MKDCIFCKIARGDMSSDKMIFENDNFFSIPDKNPIVGGHSLVISKRHFENILDLNSTLGQELLDCIKGASLKLIRETNSDGFNLISNNFESAGQVVNHFHLHIIPRKKGDGIKDKLYFR